MEEIKGLNEIAQRLHESAKNKGFWEEKREIGTLLMLIVSELSEALEADRKNKHARVNDYLNGYYNHVNEVQKKMGFELHVKDTFEDELADAMIRIFDLAGYLNIDLDWHITAKMKYNQSREHKHGKSY